MDTSGRAPEMILKFSRSLRISTKIDYLKMSFRTSILLLIVVLICGCSSKLMLGKPPLTDRLNQFTVNVTTLDDIKTALGEPQGHGATRLPSIGLKEALLYESSQIDGNKAKIKMLIVFIDKDLGIYQGHLWFASGMMFDQIQ